MKRIGWMVLLCMIVIGCCSCGGIKEHDDSSESAEFDKESEVLPVAGPDSHDIISALTNSLLCPGYSTVISWMENR